jgi:hypothetical protein
VIEVTLTNTGKAEPVDPAVHPAAAPALFANDVYRLSVAAEGEGVSAHLRNALLAVPAGESAAVSVHVFRAPGTRSGRILVTAVSESDSTKTAEVTIAVK